MLTVTSLDGTTIAFDKAGHGPALVLIDGALTTRTSGSKADLVVRLAERFTVVSYDRRGRGESTDTLPYAVPREIDDIKAIVADVGAPVFLYGHSSGGCLALEAAATLTDEVDGLALYEAPYKVDPADQQAWGDYLDLLTKALRAGEDGEAVAHFLRYVGTPDEKVASMQHAPFWPSMAAVGPTLAYDHIYLLGPDGSIPVDRARQIHVPTLVMHGGASFAFMADTARTLSETIPGATLRTLHGQSHELDPAVVAPVLIDFFLGG